MVHCTVYFNLVPASKLRNQITFELDIFWFEQKNCISSKPLAIFSIWCLISNEVQSTTMKFQYNELCSIKFGMQNKLPEDVQLFVVVAVAVWWWWFEWVVWNCHDIVGSLDLVAVWPVPVMVDRTMNEVGNNYPLCVLSSDVDHRWGNRYRVVFVSLLFSHKPAAILIQVWFLVRIGSTMSNQCRDQNRPAVVLVDSKAI